MFQGRERGEGGRLVCLEDGGGPRRHGAGGREGEGGGRVLGGTPAVDHTRLHRLKIIFVTWHKNQD